ncbi:MAG TPA: DUF4340 domain-containing protein [Bacteroidota bacterium]|nr:DUF4340 domain-containing protein [Bacteroidota bacterium]
MNRSTIILLGVLVVVGVIAYFMIFAPSNEHITSYKTPDIKVAFDSASIAKIQITKPGKSVTLENAGGNWMVTSPVKYAANPNTVKQLLSGLGKFHVGSPVSSNPSKQDLFQVDSMGTKLTVTDRSNKTTTLIIGKPGPAYSDFYWRLDGAKDVYLGDGPQAYTMNQEVKEWRDKTIFTAVQDSVRNFTVNYGGKDFTLAKANGSWTMNGDSIATTDVTPVLTSICALNADDFVDTIPNFDIPPITFMVQSGNGAPATLKFSPIAPDSARYCVQTSSNPQVFTVFKWTVSQLTKPFEAKVIPKAVPKKKGKK